MAPERLILCGGVREPRSRPDGSDPVELRLWGPGRNVFLTLEDVRRRMYRDIPPALLDLLDVAAYVYAADQAVHRGNPGADDLGASWRRNLVFRIPVRDPDLWRSPAVHDPLVETLSFLSEDEYRFEFEPLRDGPSTQQYVQFGGSEFDGLIEDVVMFSGGLDSLGGAVQEAVVDRRKVLLVNHRSAPKVTTRHQRLVNLLTRHAAPVAPLHVPVRVNKASAMGREYTQRSRSFLCAALGATFATMIGLDRLRFYENGVVSLNLPPSAQVVGARATRTTHPRVLAGFAQLLTALVGAPFAVENPFLWKTKTDVVELIAEAGCGELIGHSTSCGSTIPRTNEHPHCGDCSQCIDRRFAVLAAGQGGNDQAKGYGVDLLTGERTEGVSRALLVGYLQTAEQVEGMTPEQFFARFGETARVFRYAGRDPEVAARRVFELYQRHARQVNGVIERAIIENARSIQRRQLPPTCLLRLVLDDGQTVEPDPPLPPGPGPAPGNESGNSFRLRAECWGIRFEGQEERVYLPDIGLDYLQLLVGQPGRSVSAAELDCTVRQGARACRVRAISRTESDAEQMSASGAAWGEEILDDEGRENMTVRLREVEERLELARESDSPTRVDELETLEHERVWLDRMLEQAKGLGGRTRRVLDDRNRVRNRVCNAIRRALMRIHQYDPRLAAHLSRPVLNLGHSISYVPRDGTTWVTTSLAPTPTRQMLHDV
ncbi:MAG: hypothetical protein JWO38_5754 [Gemmataceae bacterium]|nr:hypothetical protein [Gemmataceae bacterium]